MQNTNTNFQAVRTQEAQEDQRNIETTLMLIRQKLTLKTFYHVFIKNGRYDEEDKIRLMTEFLRVDNDKIKITCDYFAQMINDLNISDEDKKMKLVTEFLGSDKAEISSLKNHNFETSLNITDESRVFDLNILKSSLIGRGNGFLNLYQIFKTFPSQFESEGLRANIIENNIKENPIDPSIDTNEYLIRRCNIVSAKYINRINKALQEIYPNQAPTQSNIGSIAETQEIGQRFNSEIQFERQSETNSQSSLQQENLYPFFSGESLLDKEAKERIKKWIESSRASGQEESRAKSITASPAMEAQTTPQTTIETEQRLSGIQGQPLISSAKSDKKSCCVVS